MNLHAMKYMGFYTALFDALSSIADTNGSEPEVTGGGSDREVKYTIWHDGVAFTVTACPTSPPVQP